MFARILPNTGADSITRARVHSPAGHCDFHFGRRNAATVGVKVTDCGRGFDFFHNVSLHGCGEPGPAPLVESALQNPMSRGRRTGARHAVQTKLPDATATACKV